MFESETDTEVIPKFMQLLYDNHKTENITFLHIVELVAQQLVSYAIIVIFFICSSYDFRLEVQLYIYI